MKFYILVRVVVIYNLLGAPVALNGAHLIWVEREEMVVAGTHVRPVPIRSFLLRQSFHLLLFQCLAHSLRLVFTVIEEHFRCEVLNVESLDVHPPEEDEVLAALQRLLGEFVTILEVYVFPLFLIYFS